MNERIKEVRKTLGLNQTVFGKRIGVNQSTVAAYENGTRAPLQAIVSSICREFNVNENWLRTGEGEMFREVSREDELAAFFGDLLSGEPDFRRRFISVLARFSPDDWKAMELLSAKLNELWDEVKAEENKKADL